MRFSLVLLTIVFLSQPISNLYGEAIYSWTDKNGIKKFSNTAPEEDVENLEVLAEMPHSEAVDTGIEDDVNEISRSKNTDNDINIDDDELNHYIKEMEVKKKQEEQEEIEAEKEENRIADDRFNQKIQKEQERLQGEIDRIEKLAVGPSLSIARKNAMIKQFQDKLDLLESSPEEYFNTNETE